mgnify:CR=1 FL=1
MHVLVVPRRHVETLFELDEDTAAQLMRVEIVQEAAQAPGPEAPPMQAQHADPVTGENEMANPSAQNPEGTLIGDDRSKLPIEALPPGWEMTGRNSPCPCGSGKKYKHCHGTLTA